MPYVITDIEEEQRRLVALLSRDTCRIDLTDAAEIDAAGAQLIAAAVRSARARGKEVALVMAPGSQPETIWRRLALDRLCQPHTTEMESALAPTDPCR